MAIVLGSFYLEMQGPLFVVAASIAVSWIILGIHLLSDVLAGSAVGMLIRYNWFHFLASALAIHNRNFFHLYNSLDS